jgi:hypothetical protein
MRPEPIAEERSAEEIRQDIAAKRDTISETVDRLGERIHQTLDWREYVADHPYVALGAAAGLGLLLSGIFKPRPTPRERIMSALAESAEDLADRFRGALSDLPLERKTGPGRTVKAAATAMITKAAVDFIKNRLTGTLAERYAHASDGQPPTAGAAASQRAEFDQRA